MIGVKNKLLIRICLFLSIFGFMFQNTQAQDKFHRLYPNQNDKNVLSLDAIQTKDGSYIALHIELEEQENPQDTLYGDTLIITSFKPKGDVNWSKSISLSGKYKSFNPQLSSIVQGQNDSIYYSVTALEDNLPVNLLGSLHINGNLGFLKASGVSATVADNSGESSLLVNYNKALFNAYGAVAGNEQSIHLSKKNYNGNISWVKSLGTTVNNANVPESLLGFEFADDTTFIMTGLLDSLAPKPFIAVLDTLGNPLMSKSYTDLGFPITISYSCNAHKFSDGSYVLTGFINETVIVNENAVKGFIIKLDSKGNVSWSKKLQVNSNDYTYILNSIVDRDDNIVIAGTNIDMANPGIYPFMIKIDKAGKIIWKKKFGKNLNVYTYNFSSLLQTRDQGYVFYTTAFKDGLSVPSFIKTDKDGASGCESELAEILFKDNLFKADTLVWNVATISNMTENVLAKSNAHSFEVPVLSLSVRPFCPNEPIVWTFDASVQGATSYLWNDNSTADTLRVFAEGEYSVMVKIDEDVCYTLCDTAKLERYTKPQAQINLSLGNFCTNGKQTLSLGYQPGHPQVKSITWSTGESGASIEIATPGTYRVTVVDQCDETATALINVGPFPQKLSAATITGDPTVNCIRGTISGLLTASGNAVGLGDMTYRWSTGTSTAVLSLNDSEVLTYTVTVTDICGTTATATKVVELKGSNTDFQITKSNSGVCKDKTITLNIVASTFSPKLKYNWSNGQTTANITTSQAGTYTATLTDGCNNNVSKQIEISSSEFEIKDLVFAKLFFPDGTLGPNEVDTTAAYKDAEKYNRTFGPVNLPEYCIQDVTDYELHVFNRWGQEVFVSNNIFDEWDGGAIQGDQAPTESYLWVARYKILGTEKTLKGSVTMLRR